MRWARPQTFHIQILHRRRRGHHAHIAMRTLTTGGEFTGRNCAVIVHSFSANYDHKFDDTTNCQWQWKTWTLSTHQLPWGARLSRRFDTGMESGWECAERQSRVKIDGWIVVLIVRHANSRYTHRTRVNLSSEYHVLFAEARLIGYSSNSLFHCSLWRRRRR